jgi:hypothetical protein
MRVVPAEAEGGVDERRAPQARRGTEEFAGRKPWDEVVIFKVLVLQALYVPDAKTLWLYRETLAKAGVVERLGRVSECIY